MQQGNRNAVQIAGHEDGRSRNTARPLRREPLDELAQWQRIAGAQLGQQPTASPPRQHYGKEHTADGQRKPAALVDLQQVSPKKREIDGQEQREYRYELP